MVKRDRQVLHYARRGRREWRRLGENPWVQMGMWIGGFLILGFVVRMLFWVIRPAH